MLIEQSPLQTYSVVIDTDRSPTDTASLLRSTINTIDRAQPFTPIVPMPEYVQRNLSGSKLQAELLSVFTVVALIVAAAGLYALLTYLVSGARRDWAVRLALGASEMDLRRAVLKQSAVYALVGISLGAALFLVAVKVLAVTAYNVTLWNPVLLGVCGIVMLMVCILAATLPALRAGRISAIEALRSV